MIKKLVYSLLVFLSIGVCVAAVISVGQFGGLNTDVNPLFITNQTPDSQNVITDDGVGLSPRTGFIIFSTEPSRNLYSFYVSGGSRYLITQSSNILKATLGGNTFNILISTVDPNVNTSLSALGDKLYFINTTDGLKSWDTSTVSIASSTLRGSLIATHKGRIWVAGVTGDERTIYVSKYLDGSDFAIVTDPVDASPTRLQVQGALDDVLTVLYATYLDKLVWMKQRSWGMIDGTRYGGFKSREYSNNVGCSYQDSVKNCSGLLRWLGNDRVIYEFNGESYYPINGDIDTLMKTLKQGELSQRQWTQTSVADWNSGTIEVGLDTATTIGSITMPAIIYTDPFDNISWDSSSGTWEQTNDGTTAKILEPTGSYFNAFSQIYTTSSVLQIISSQTITKSATYFVEFINFDTIDRTYFEDNKFNMRYFISRSSPNFEDSYLGSNYDIAGGNCIELKKLEDGNWELNFVSVSSSNLNIYTKHISETIDEADLFVSNEGQTYFGVSLSLVIEANSDGNFDVSMYKKYRFEANYTFVGSATLGYDILINDDYKYIGCSIRYPNSSYYDHVGFNNMDIWSDIITNLNYVSKTFNTGGKMSEWDTFEVNSTLSGDGSNITYRIFGDTDNVIDINDSTTFIDSQTITDGIKPTIETNRYITISADFSRVLPTEYSILHDFTVNFNEGSSIRTFSEYIKQRYWLGVAISSTSNNRVLVYDKNKQWQLYNGINIDAIVNYSGIFYFGNSNGIFQAEYGTDDNGAPISSYYKSKTFATSGMDIYSTFKDLWVTSENSDLTLMTEYFVDGYSTSIDLSTFTLNTQLGYQNFRLPFKDAELKQGKYIALKWSISSIYDWRLLNANLYYDSDIEPSEETR